MLGLGAYKPFFITFIRMDMSRFGSRLGFRYDFVFGFRSGSRFGSRFGYRLDLGFGAGS